jgi:hypothetical protein
MNRSVGAAARLPESDRQELAIQALARSEKVSDLAARHGVSRKFVYAQTHKARIALDGAFLSATAEDEVLFELVVKELHDINRRLLAMIQDVSAEMRHVREEVRDLLAQPAQPKPIDPRQTLPGVADITRLELQLFNNVAIKAKRKALGKSGRGTPNFKLKLNAWTCPKSEIGKHRNGTCGNFYMTMLPPGRALVKQLGHALDYLNADDAKFVGCLGGTSKFSKKRVIEQAAIIMPITGCSSRSMISGSTAAYPRWPMTTSRKAPTYAAGISRKSTARGRMSRIDPAHSLGCPTCPTL